MHVNFKICYCCFCHHFLSLGTYCVRFCLHKIRTESGRRKKGEKKIMNFCCSFHIHHKLDLRRQQNRVYFVGIFFSVNVFDNRLTVCLYSNLTLTFFVFFSSLFSFYFLSICCEFFEGTKTFICTNLYVWSRIEVFKL